MERNLSDPFDPLGRIRWYDRQGRPIATLLEWARLMENPSYKIVARTILEDGTFVSTIWLGLDHSFSEITGVPSAPIIFETMVFSPVGEASKLLGSKRICKESWDCERYATEAEALAGHDRMVAKWKKERSQIIKPIRPAHDDDDILTALSSMAACRHEPNG